MHPEYESIRALGLGIIGELLIANVIAGNYSFVAAYKIGQALADAYTKVAPNYQI